MKASYNKFVTCLGLAGRHNDDPLGGCTSLLYSGSSIRRTPANTQQDHPGQ
jgi:hypothetical protein